MNEYIMLFLLILASHTSFSQVPDLMPHSLTEPRRGNLFRDELYPKDSFSIRRLSHPLGSTTISVILLHHDYDLKTPYQYQMEWFFQIWLEQRKGDRVLKSQYFGFEEGENFYQVSPNHMDQGYFLFLSQGEFTGTLYLIDTSGAWHQLDGSNFCYCQEQNTIYSFVPQECGGCTVSSFNLNTHELIKKESNGNDSQWREYPTLVWKDMIFDWEERVEWSWKE